MRHGWKMALLCAVFISTLGPAMPVLAQHSGEDFVGRVARGFTVVVRPEEEAVVAREDGTYDLLSPGVHVFNPATEKVTAYPKFVERQHVVPGAFMIETCPADVAVIYRIGDVLAFHLAGGSLAPIEVLNRTIADMMGGETVTFDTPLGKVMERLHTRLEATAPAGFKIVQVSADRGRCGPQPPRIVFRNEAVAVPGLAAPEPAAHEVPVWPLEVVTADDARLVLEGVAVWLDVSDETKFRQCHRSNGLTIASDRVALLAQVEVRRIIGAYALEDLGRALADPSMMQTAQMQNYASDCGVLIRSMDFSGADVMRRIPVNCDDRPAEEVCRQ